MLQLLHIKNFVIVDEANIYFDKGFSVFSGETGAGKSILIDALSLALGARAEQGFIKQGANRTEISAVFLANDTTKLWLKEHGFSIDDDQLILRRIIGRNNRSRAFINGSPTTLTQLRGLSALLVDIHGQHAHQSLLNSRTHVRLLDEQAQLLELSEETKNAWNMWQKSNKIFKAAQQETAQAKETLAKINKQIEQLEDLNLAKDEWEQLTQEHQRLAHAHTLVEELSLANQLLAPDNFGGNNTNQGAQNLLHQANQHVEKALSFDKQLKNVAQSLASAHIACSEAISELNSYLSSIDVDPARLEKIDQRMSKAFELARDFRCEPNELPQKLQKLLEQQVQLQDSLDLEKLKKECQKAQQNFHEKAKKLSYARQQAGAKLSKDITAVMQTLAMEGGRFEVQLKPCAPHAGGYEQVTFLVAGHSGVTPAPLAKVASGGELARISLALSVIASKATRVPTLIFDEVDAGIGGAVAEVVGQLLAQLGKRHQVLCVTHLAQVAACASHHYQVSKSTTGQQTVSRIQPLNKTQRVEELARMIAGIHITETTLKHAHELLHTNLNST